MLGGAGMIRAVEPFLEGPRKPQTVQAPLQCTKAQFFQAFTQLLKCATENEVDSDASSESEEQV